MLSGPEIVRQVELGNISITGFDPEKVGPNSYDLTLDRTLRIYERYRFRHFRPDVFSGGWTEHDVLDPRTPEPTVDLVIPDAGMILWPGILYLGSTVEHTETHGFVPCLEGRSSIGRLGVGIHVTAGFGDDGFKGTWVLEITTVHPVRLYPEMKICQIYYSRVEGERKPYRGKYLGQEGPQASKMYVDLSLG